MFFSVFVQLTVFDGTGVKCTRCKQESTRFVFGRGGHTGIWSHDYQQHQLQVNCFADNFLASSLSVICGAVAERRFFFCRSSPTLWVHSVMALVLLVIAVIFMRHFSVNLQYEQDEQVTKLGNHGGLRVLDCGERSFE